MWVDCFQKSHRIHVWYIYLHLVDFNGKCRHIYHTWVLWAWYFGSPSFMFSEVYNVSTSNSSYCTPMLRCFCCVSVAIQQCYTGGVWEVSEKKWNIILSCTERGLQGYNHSYAKWLSNPVTLSMCRWESFHKMVNQFRMSTWSDAMKVPTQIPGLGFTIT